VGGRLDRYLLEEISAPFVVGVLVILVMLLGDSLYYLMSLVIVHGVGLGTVTRLLLFILPEMMANAFPLATILAVSLGVSRLAREGEWTAMRLSGVSLPRMLAPFVGFGVAVALMTWSVAEHLAPAANVEFARVVTAIGLSKPTVVLKPQTWYRPTSGESAFYVGGVDDATGTLRHLLLFTDLRSDYPSMLSAASARYSDGKFVLERVIRHVWRPDGTLQREGESRQAILRIDQLASATSLMPRLPETRSAAQLRETISAARKHGAPDNSVLLDLHRRYAGPAACLVLALLCVPLNLAGGRRGGYMGLLISAVLVVVYFLTLQLGLSLARTGFLQRLPVLGAWLQNVVFGLLALVLLRRAR
jgi:lipopolysaccharide export LptBFGC system permease protein LptF